MTKWLSDFWGWIDDRLPVQRAWDTHMAKYYAPKNFNFWYIFGVLSLLVLVNQLLTGVWLTMNYVPTAEGAFASVEYIMRDVPYGDILRYMHSTGASAFFVVVYLHMFRGLMYGSYRAPRELLWIFGMFIYVALMAEAFMGYILPWGNMSYWGAQVIVSLFGAIPGIGGDLVQWIRGDYLISGITLNRFFALHVVALPIVLILLVFLHILALHEVGSNNPDGVEIKKNKDENGIPKDGVPFFPYYLPLHDLVGIVVFLFAFCGIIFFMPEMGGYFIEYANYEPANNLKTPEHIAPVWYFTPFYSMLRAVTVDIGPLNSKFLGFVVMAAAIAILFVLPWLDRSKVKSIRYKGWMPRLHLMLFAAMFIVLGYLGVKSPTAARAVLAQIATVAYFAFFLQMPVYTTPHLRTGIIGWATTAFLGALTLYIALFTGGDGITWFVRAFGVLIGLFILLTPVFTSRDVTFEEPERVRMKGLPLWLTLGGLLLVAVLSLAPIKAVAADAAFDCGTIPCDEFEADRKDQESLQRGAKWFANYCYGCHALQYSRYSRVATDLGIPPEVMEDTLVPVEHKIGDLMTNAMAEDEAKVWFGTAPPDLSLETSLRSPEWVYTYLRNFYKDESRAVGVNNRVFPSVAMPHAMVELQGLMECAPGPRRNAHGEAVLDANGQQVLDFCGELVPSGEIEGSMTPEQFDQAVYDLVNYLDYVSDPGAQDRRETGVYVLLFLAAFLVFAILLDREYWRDIH